MNQLALDSQPTSEYRTIRLTQGRAAIIDAADYEWLSQWKWCAVENKYRGVFYAVRRSPRKGEEPRHTEIMHRLILGLKYGDCRLGDHINLNTLDNRRSNLRIASSSQSQCNRGKQKNNSSGFKGVSFDKKMRKWQAYIKINRKRRNLGYFSTSTAAYSAYCVAATELHGEFKRLE
jgi:hypothetical protein